MLSELHIKNLALIEEQEIRFKEGLNILSGETGAGKSILIGSINLCLGDKADASFIRAGAEYALIEMTFTDLDAATIARIEALDVPVEDGSITLQRRISEGRSVAKVSGETVSLKVLKELASMLLRIHGQNDHQTLLQLKEQAQLLDTYAAEELEEPLARTAKAFADVMEALRRERECTMDEATRKREEDIALYELEEITKADVKEGEDERLEEDFQRMNNADRIQNALKAAEALTASESDGSVLEQIGRALKELNAAASYDAQVSSLAAQLSEMDALLSDFHRGVTQALDASSLDPEALQRVTERLNTINHLKDKYGGSIASVLAYQTSLEERIERLHNLDRALEEIRQQKLAAEDILMKSCEEVSAIRKRYAAQMEKEVREGLKDLNFLDNQFEIQIRQQEEHPTASGFDTIEFFLCLNPGEPLKPLKDIASGGELSRIMLAIQTMLSGKADAATLVFDEVDAGISGDTAWKVAEHLGTLAKKRQLLCITHLAQIASMEDAHFLIRKEVVKQAGDSVRTITGIKELDPEESLSETARLLGGTPEETSDKDSAAYENARRLREKAHVFKAQGEGNA